MFNELQVVKVVRLLSPHRSFEGTQGISREPHVGDQGTIVHVLAPGKAFTVESVNSDGLTIWLADFQAEELEADLASHKTLEVLLASPPEREELVAQLFVKEGAQWGEIMRDSGRYCVELYGRADGQPWRLDFEEFKKVIDLAHRELSKRLK